MKSELHKKIREENYAIRFLVYIVGLFIMTLGISLSVKSNLGVSPVSSIPYTITCITGLEMGKATILFGCDADTHFKKSLSDEKPVASRRRSHLWLLYHLFKLSVFLFTNAGAYDGAAADDAWQHGTDCGGNLFLSAGRHCAVSRRRSDESSVGYNPYRI